ncbi:MAG: GNAT family N-acetyltransferase [Bryobacterales bacterium]|nr:GNAT family N-acetyltransferase [Bryobacterales bacterium]
MAAFPKPDRDSLTVRIAGLGRSDLGRVARLHCRAFTSSLLTALGRGAVERYYRWQLEGPHDCVALGAWAGEELAGFCFAGVFRGALSGFLRKNRGYLAAQLLMRGGLLRNPEFRSRAGQAVRLVLPRKPADPQARPAGKGETFGILSIAVDPASQGCGVGRRLMQACEAIARERGFAGMELTVAVDNHQAIRFYEREGWARIAVEGAWRGQLRKAII